MNGKGFFRKIDWAAFWTATLAAFAVYFFTLGPSVGLEDSGELATAADHLGVPHPPGYPFWSLICWFFCRAFSWVTYMGHPTPAWAVSLCSAVTGALAAGCTAMLICRSSSDMLDAGTDSTSETEAGDLPAVRLHAWAGFSAGVGAALVFAFSPVMWSQATIVEIYALNALFLMAVFLLSYRWMRQPSDKILWLTAFVFGLGLTNYQVLLLAAVPLAIIIAAKNIRLFRDFILLVIPVGLTYLILKVGSMLKASRYMSADVINKFDPLTATESCPNEWILGLGLILVIAAPLVGLLVRRDKSRAALFTGGAGAALVFLSATLFTAKATWTGPVESVVAPLIEPAKYALIGSFLAAAVAAALGAAFAPAEENLKSKKVWPYLAAAAFCGFVALTIAAGIRAAGADGYAGTPFSWTQINLATLGGLVILFLLVLTTPRGLAFAIPVAAVQLTALVLLQKGAMNGLTNPHSWWFLWPVFWNFIILALAMATLPHGRAIAPALFFAELGVSFYAYMPIVSDLRNPPMNWGYPRTWEGFKHAIMRGQYEQIQMGEIFSMHFVHELGFYLKDIRLQFTLVLGTLALIPFTFWRATFGKFRFRAVYASIALYVTAAVLVTLFSEILGGAEGEVPFRLDKILIALIFLLIVVGICLRIWNFFAARKGRAIPFSYGADRITWQWLLASGACFAMMSVLLIALANTKGDVQDGFIQKVKFISSHGMFSLWIGYGVALGIVVANRLIASFVKDKTARKFLFAVLCVMAIFTAGIPVYENYTNDRLVFELGCAEQNGHTFGWQFGAYQLQGAEQIRDEIAQREEEPLPNPIYPPRMEDHAIFFGGTDPGRFVPTYMIYSADFRPDVYLITQNALADDTYMSVERDLYGDEIWIPSKEDSAESFNIYVNEVQSGKRQANAALKIENGRVQVTGALGVMEINGVLTKMMFDHERLRHGFYVEESYVIQWMYPYLAPHGLIMKIRPDAGPLSRTNITDDMEFWDWYTRRLLRDGAFRRDFPAQKSFSKLRAAIAGLYARTGHGREAASAYREACLLYPASPEASFRYIQEILLPLKRWREIADILDYTDRVDPNNGRTGDMRGYMQRLRVLTDEINALQAKASANQATTDELLRLAQDYAAIGQMGLAVMTVRQALTRPDAARSFDCLFLAARILAQAGQRGDAALFMKKAAALLPPQADEGMRQEVAAALSAGGLHAEAETVLNDLLRRNPTSADAWLLLCETKAALGDTTGAQNAFMQAYRANSGHTMERLRASENIQRIAAPLFKRQ